MKILVIKEKWGRNNEVRKKTWKKKMKRNEFKRRRKTKEKKRKIGVGISGTWEMRGDWLEQILL